MLNLLDGLRDLKAPLASGVVILFALWLVFANEISEVQPGYSLLGNIRRLTDYVGVPATLGIVAFIAYLLGLILSPHKILFYFLGDFAMTADTTYRFRRHVRGLVEQAVKRGPDVDDVYKAMLPFFDTKNFDYSRDPIDTCVAAANAAMWKDRYFLAAQLQMAQEKTFEQYDKAKTEADFRGALVLPLGLLTAVVLFRLPSDLNVLWWSFAGALVAVGVLWRLARVAATRYAEANQILVNALLLGHIKLPVMTALESLGPHDSKAL